jgi:poly-gamma-glutamate synthesis protein (capsule biosynthesis protein)
MTEQEKSSASPNRDAVKIIVTGDLCPLGKIEQRLCRGETETLFGKLLPELLDKDLAITNLETVLTKSETPIEKWGPNLKVSPECLPALNQAGFDVYSLANNHTRDFGDAAFLETMRHISRNGKHYVGGGSDLASAAQPLRLVSRGLRISIVAATMHNICVAGHNHPGANPLEPAALAIQIATERKHNDFVLVIAHDGKEHCPFPSARIRRNYRTFIEAGAHAVIGHHPHIMQGFERYKNGFIAYSLGNFLFPHREGRGPGFWTKSYSLRLHINSKGVFGVDVLPHELLPENRMQPLSGNKRRDFLARLEKLNRILEDDALGDRYYDAMALTYTYYMQRVAELVKLTEAGDTGSAYQEAMSYCHHMLTTEEHLDVIRSLTKASVSKSKPELPDDLDFYLK